MKKVTKENFRRSNRAEPRLRWHVLASIFAASVMCMSARALEVYQIPGNVTDGIDLLGMSDNYYTDRLKGRNNCTISGEVTHSSVTAESPFLLMGSHSGATAFNPSTKLDTIPIRIVGGGSWKYQADNGGNANYQCGAGQSGSSYGHLEFESGSFQANALLLYGETETTASLSIPGNCSATFGTTVRVGTHEKSATLSIDGGNLTAYTMLEMSRGPKGSTASANTSVNTVIVRNGTLSLSARDTEGSVYMGQFGANDGADRTTDRDVIIIGENGVLRVKAIYHKRDPRGHIIFRGGRLELFRRGTTYVPDYAVENVDSGTLEIEGDGYPIRMDTQTNVINLVNTTFISGSILLTGNGGFEKLGVGTLTMNNRYGTVISSFSGGVAVAEGTLKVAADGIIPATNLLTVAEGATFDMNGSAVGFTGAVGAGIVTNSSESVATLTLGYGDGDNAFSTAVGGDVSIVKTGNGRLMISGNAANNACDLDIMSGTVAFGVKNSSAYRNVTVRSGATLDISKCNFVCTNLVKEPGGIIKHKPGLSIFIR